MCQRTKEGKVTNFSTITIESRKQKVQAVYRSTKAHQNRITFKSIRSTRMMLKEVRFTSKATFHCQNFNERIALPLVLHDAYYNTEAYKVKFS